jgi:hypothetical protein
MWLKEKKKKKKSQHNPCKMFKIKLFSWHIFMSCYKKKKKKRKKEKGTLKKALSNSILKRTFSKSIIKALISPFKSVEFSIN